MSWTPMLALTASLASSPAVHPQDCALVRTRLLDETFDSILTAVRFTGSTWLEDSRRFDREWVGGVLQHADGYFKVSAGAGCSGQDTVTFSVPVPSEFEIVAFWHTHGEPGYARSWFSAEDSALVADTGKDFYLVTPAGELKVLKPEDVPYQSRPTSGRRVEAQFEAEPFAV